MPNELISSPPRYYRSAPTRSGQSARVDRAGGFRREGIIRDVSVITKGEALGHDMWIDEEFVSQVAGAIAMRNKGVKSRFTHPGMSGDGLGKFVGRIMDARMSDDGSRVIADQHFTNAGHNTPDGDLAGYLMDLAEEDPEAYGLSIVFEADIGETDRFTSEHRDKDGNFVSPDPLNVKDLPHVRLASLRAVDAVDEPAANPDGLFHRGGDIAGDAEKLAAYALGLSQDRPNVMSLGLDPDRVRGFVSRFLHSHEMEVRSMSENHPEEQSPDTPPATEALSSDEPRENDLQRFYDRFGDQGAVWCAQGIGYEEAERLYAQQQSERLAEQEERIAELERRVAADQSGEAAPVDFDAADTDQPRKRKGFASRIRMPGQPAT